MTSRFGFAGYSLVALVAIAALGCSPDRAIAPNDRPRPSGPAADIANLPTTAPILYAQPSPGFSMSGASGDDTTLFADDFEVPAGEVWTVKELVVSGQLLNNTQLLAISIRDNVGGVPGAPRPGANAALSPVKSDPPDGPSVGNPFVDYLFSLPTAVALTAGTYWLAVQVSRPCVDPPNNMCDTFQSLMWRDASQAGMLAMESDDNGASWSVRGGGRAFVLFGTLQKTQTISLASVTPNPAPLGSATTLSATASSGLAVTLDAEPTNVCALSGTTLSFVGLGTCTVTADQAGDATYLPASQVTQNIVVAKVSQSITFPAITPNPATVGGSATLDATASSKLAVSYSSLTQSVCTVSGSTVSYIAAGTCTVAANQAGNAGYEAAAQATQSVTVNQAAQAITFTSPPPASPTVGGTYTVTATGGASGNPVMFGSSTPNVCTVAGSTVSFVIGGSCTVTANQTGNAIYLAAGQVTQTFTVSKAAQAIAWTSTPPSPAYLNATYTVGGTGGASGNSVAFTVGPANVCAANGTTVRFVGVGTCVIAANQGGNNAFAAAAQVTQSVKVDYRYTGFLDPVKNNGVLNGARVGQVIPLKWRLTDAAAAPVTTLTTAAITARDLSCSLAGSTKDQVTESTSGASGLQNLGNGYYQLNWKVPATYANSCKTLQLDLGEGSGTRTARFAFTK